MAITVGLWLGLLLSLVVLSFGCVPRPAPKPPAPTVRVFDVVLCAGGDELPCPVRVQGRVLVEIEPNGWLRQDTDADGYTLFTVPASLVFTRLQLEADGFEPRTIEAFQPAACGDGCHNVYQLKAKPPPVAWRHGPVRIDNRAFVDDDGPMPALGASLFWGAWAYKFDRPRLEQNLADLQAAGVDYIRVLGSSGFTDRTTDPNWPDYDEVLAGLIDLAYDTYGIRTHLTIFGWTQQVPTASRRAALVDRIAAIANARPAKVWAVELANESWQNGFGGEAGIAELRELGRRLNAATTVPVALSAPPGDDPNRAPSLPSAVCALYARSGVDLVTMHYERDFRGDGPWRPVRQPWGWTADYDGSGYPVLPPWACVGQLPRAVSSNEPIGPESSVLADDDPLRIVLGYVTTFVAGNSAYVFHSGPGIRGGGPEDLARGRHAHFRELPHWDAYRDGLKRARGYLPTDLANWTRQNAQWAGYPFDGVAIAVGDGRLVRSYVATKGDQFFGVVLGLKRPVIATAKRQTAVEVLDPVTGEVLQSHVLMAGASFTLTPRPERDAYGDGVVLRGSIQP